MIGFLPGPRTTCLPALNEVQQAGRLDDAFAVSFPGPTIRKSAPRIRSEFTLSEERKRRVEGRHANPSPTAIALRSTSHTFTTKSKSGRNSASFPKKTHN
jgi:hypothetical protein